MALVMYLVTLLALRDISRLRFGWFDACVPRYQENRGCTRGYRRDIHDTGKYLERRLLRASWPRTEHRPKLRNWRPRSMTDRVRVLDSYVGMKYRSEFHGAVVGIYLLFDEGLDVHSDDYVIQN